MTNPPVDTKLIEALDYLNNIKNPSLMVKDELFHSSLIYIKSSLFINQNLDLNIFLEKNSHEVFSELLNYLCTMCDELDIDNYVEKQQPPCENTVKVEMLFIILSLVNILISRSVKFNTHINKTLIIMGHFHLLRSDNFIEKCGKNKLVYYLEFVVGNINWLSRYCGEENRKKWVELEGITLLIKLSKLSEACILSAYQAISNIANEKQIEAINQADIQFGLKNLIKTFKSVTNGLLKNKSSIVDGTIQVIISDKTIQKQAHFIIGNGRQSVFGIIQALYKLAVNDKIKEEIYFGFKVKEDLRIILDNSFSIEKRLTVKFVAHLSFNKKIGDDLIKDKEYMEFINKFISDDAKQMTETPDEKKSCHRVYDVVVKHYG